MLQQESVVNRQKPDLPLDLLSVILLDIFCYCLIELDTRNSKRYLKCNVTCMFYHTD